VTDSLWGSRALLLPGPVPPLSHFGVTLLRHAVGAGLRYALYHLGLPLPPSPPVRIVRLRLYLDGEALRRLLAPAAGGAEVAAALLDPAGAGRLPAAARSLAAAAVFHRLRQRLFARLPSRRPRLGEPLSADLAWDGVRATLGRLVPALGEGVLAELLASLARRARRARGATVPPCLSHNARRLLAAAPGRLDLFGPPDPRLPSWAPAPARAAACAAALRERLASVSADRGRGRFREAYRAVLDRLKPGLVGLAAAAVERGTLAEPDDLYFLPYDLGADLLRHDGAAWLSAAAAANRREHHSWLAAPAPAELLASPAGAEAADSPGDWECAALLPLP
jgi:hypothetical protein